ncbi:MAG: hypothetical protein KDI92_09040 [Xanthomonadales bacterium]|nr:hypothetical protein [Xanthomonadales bacterium]
MLSYLNNLWVILGLLIIVGFFVFRFLINTQRIENLPGFFDTPTGSFLLTKGYTLGMLLIICGVFIQYNARTKAEQQHAQMMIATEYRANIEVIQSLTENIQNLIDSHKQITERLYSEDNDILAILFPVESLQNEVATPVNKVVESAFKKLKDSDLLNNLAAMEKFNSFKSNFKPFINEHINELKAMEDPNNIQYSIKQPYWDAYKTIFSDIGGKNSAEISSSIEQMKQFRVEYLAVLKQAETYFNQVKSFVGRDSFISNGDIYETIKLERESLQRLNQFYSELEALSQAAATTLSHIQ